MSPTAPATPAASVPTSASSELVTCEVDGGIARVRLNRPDKLNALTLDTLDALVATGRRLRRDRTLRGVLLAGEGRSFCAGLDFASVQREGQAATMRRFVARPWRGTNTFQEACWTWRRLPVPVVAAVHGHCFGGGLQIALGADLRLTTPDAQWSVMEGRWGLVPDMSGVRSLAQHVGMDVAKLLTMTADTIDGTEAARIGLATQVCDDPQADALALLERLALRSPDQLAATKRLFERRWTSSPRVTFLAERLEQAVLMAAPSTKAVRAAAKAEDAPRFGPRIIP